MYMDSRERGGYNTFQMIRTVCSGFAEERGRGRSSTDDGVKVVLGSVSLRRLLLLLLAAPVVGPIVQSAETMYYMYWSQLYAYSMTALLVLETVMRTTLFCECFILDTQTICPMAADQSAGSSS
jgi:hypothetical protein